MFESIVVISIFVLTVIVLFYLINKVHYIHLTIGTRKFFIESYALGVLIGPLLLLSSRLLSFKEVGQILKGYSSSSPLGILILFLSMVFISVFLDNVGFMEYCAKLALKSAGNNGRKLFFSLYLIVSVLTLFTSNDIVILTLTPFIYYFAKHSSINPKPYLIAEFFAANTWSIMLQISNPTNIFITSAFHIKFMEYLKLMFLPTLLCGLANIIMLYFIFRKDIDITMKTDKKIHPEDAIKDKSGAILGVLFLTSCIISLAVAPYFGFEMWGIALFFAGLLFVTIVFRDIYRHLTKKEKSYMITHTLLRMPWTVVPFIASFFIIVGALSKYGITSIVGGFFAQVASPFALVFVYGIISTLACNVLNNIPMSVAFSSIMTGLSGTRLLAAALSTVAGSNLGANLTPMGALAGIMWMNILKHKDFHISVIEFSYYGFMVTMVTLGVVLLTLALELMVF